MLKRLGSSPLKQVLDLKATKSQLKNTFVYTGSTRKAYMDVTGVFHSSPSQMTHLYQPSKCKATTRHSERIAPTRLFTSRSFSIPAATRSTLATTCSSMLSLKILSSQERTWKPSLVLSPCHNMEINTQNLKQLI